MMFTAIKLTVRSHEIEVLPRFHVARTVEECGCVSYGAGFGIIVFHLAIIVKHVAPGCMQEWRRRIEKGEL